LVLGAAEGSVDIAAGNVVGSNIPNVALVAAVAALIAPLRASSQTLPREAPSSVLAMVGLAIALQTGLTRAGGVLLTLALAPVGAWIVRSTDRRDSGLGAGAATAGGTGRGATHEAGRTSVGLLGAAAGAQLVLFGAEG
jgi:cation:H+ antiporter